MTEADRWSGYSSPLSGRYASAEMQAIWSPRRKFETWRRIWLAVAEAQHELGLPVSKEQVEELRANLDITDEDMQRAEKYERELRHDVMAHIHAWGDRCPNARSIIHLGMTSQDVNDNCELALLDDAKDLITEKLERLIVALGTFSESSKSTPTLGFTHYQPAQPTTVGRRAAQWSYDLVLIEDRMSTGYPLARQRGLRGATGTQASFLQLLNGDEDAVKRLEFKFIAGLHSPYGIDGTTEREQLLQEFVSGELASYLSNEPIGDVVDQNVFLLTGQTYPRIFDAMVLSDLGAIAAVLHKIATDIRLLSNRKELDEPFESSQIGSSAMPYKRNPMRCERICSLARFVWNLVGNAYDTAATQWLERTLDDSANRRLVLPEAFLALDGCLNIMHNVVSGLVVNEAQVRKNLMAELPFLITESLMMEAVKLGRDRQDVHEAIRQHSMEAGRRIKQEGAENDLIDRLKAEQLLKGVDIDGQMDPMKHIGLAVEQTERFISEVIEPLRAELSEQDGSGGAPDLHV